MFPLPRWLLCLLLVFTSECTAQQIAKAFPWDLAPRYLLHDRDSIYGEVSRQRVRGMAKRDVLAAARSPWQDPYVERLDRLTALNEKSLRQMGSN
jgi:hypothetical protein